MVNCYQHGVNCVLADEMGLGKTIQTIAYLTYITLGDEKGSTQSNKKAKTSSSSRNDGQKSNNNENIDGDGGPSLVVLPLSVLTSWMQELKRFSPELRVVRLHSGDEKERERLRLEVQYHAYLSLLLLHYITLQKLIYNFNFLNFFLLCINERFFPIRVTSMW